MTENFAYPPDNRAKMIVVHVDYRELCIELFDTDDVETLRKIAGKKKSGRKKKFNESDINDILTLYSSGMTIEKIAKRYNTSREHLKTGLKRENG